LKNRHLQLPFLPLGLDHPPPRLLIAARLRFAVAHADCPSDSADIVIRLRITTIQTIRYINSDYAMRQTQSDLL